MAGGWGNEIMQDEPSFIVLEGFCVLIPVLLLASFQPGFLFPEMAERMRTSSRKAKKMKGEKGQQTPESAAERGVVDTTAAKEGNESGSQREV